MKIGLRIYAQKVILFVRKRNPSEPGSFDEVTGLCWGGKIVRLLADKKECNKLCAHHFCSIMLVSKICILVTLAMPIYIYIYK